MVDWLNYKKALTVSGRVLPHVQPVVLRNSIDSQSKRDTQWLHPSEICKEDWCPRFSFYQLTSDNPHVEEHQFGLLNVFAEGNMIHDKWQGWLADAGVLYGRWECVVCHNSTYGFRPESCEECQAAHQGWVRYREVPIFDAEHGVIGHSDGHIKDSKGEALIEIKSVGIGTLRFEAPDLWGALNRGTMKHDEAWKAIRYPFKTHIRQGQLYMHFTGIHTIVFIYECKWNQQVKEFTIHYDHAKVSDILKGCIDVAKARSANMPPMRPQWAITGDNRICNKCPHQKTCWKESDEDSTEQSNRDGVGISPGRSVEVVSEEVRPSRSSSGVVAGDPVQPRRLVRRKSDGAV